MTHHAAWSKDIPVGDTFDSWTLPFNYLKPMGGGTGGPDTNFTKIRYKRLSMEGFPVEPEAIEYFAPVTWTIRFGVVMPVPTVEVAKHFGDEWRALANEFSNHVTTSFTTSSDAPWNRSPAP